jgi:hypothetical protein
MTENKEVPEINFDENGELMVMPASTSSKNDFDFFMGKWQLQNKKLKERLNNSSEWVTFESMQEMHTILNGVGNIDNFLA